jgi:phage tail P2-like protein
MSSAPTDLLPPNATPLELALARTMAAQIGALPVPLRDLWNPASCPVPLLPWLAGTVGVDGWDGTWPETVQRARIAAAIMINRHKGTLGAVQNVIAAYGGTVQMTRWDQTEPPGVPFSFALAVALGAQGGVPPTAAFIDGLIADVTRAKGARDTFTFTVALNAIGAIGLFGAARPAVYARLEFSQ